MSANDSNLIPGDPLSHYNVKTLHINLRSSYLLVWLMGAASLISCLILLFLQLMLAVKIIAISAVLVTTVYCIRRYALLSWPSSITQLDLNHESKLQLTFREGKRREAKPLESSFVAAYLTVLNMQLVDNGKIVSLILVADNTEPDSFRQLRVWLRWGRQPMIKSTDLA